MLTPTATIANHSSGAEIMIPNRIAVVCATVFAGAWLSACSATQVALSKKDLDVQTKMSDSIFLDPVADSQMSIYIKIRNTSDKPNFDLDAPIKQAMQAKGYRVMSDPSKAHYTLLANVLSVGKESPTAAEAALRNGYGGSIAAGAVAGATVGHAASGWSGAGYGGAIGGLVGGAAEVVSGSLVKDVSFIVITDIELRERAKAGVIVRQDQRQDAKQGIGGARTQSSSEVTDFKAYRTRVVSTANKVNLAYEEAAPALTDGLTRSLAGLF